MSMYALLRNSPIPNMKDLEVAFQGNLLVLHNLCHKENFEPTCWNILGVAVLVTVQLLKGIEHSPKNIKHAPWETNAVK